MRAPVLIISIQLFVALPTMIGASPWLDGTQPLPRLEPSYKPIPVLTDEQISKLTILHPSPKYPADAASLRVTGKGVFELIVSPNTGYVEGVAIVTSTRSLSLDRAAVKGLNLWKFKRHTVGLARVVVEFTLDKKSTKTHPNT